MLKVRTFISLFLFFLLAILPGAACAQATPPKALQHRMHVADAADSVRIDSVTTDGAAADSLEQPVQMPDTLKRVAVMSSDSLQRVADSMTVALGDSLQGGTTVAVKPRWMPDSKRALWLAIVFPGGGQIYNRKYWKLPIFYGGFLGCFYALSWNNTMYQDYSQAYIDIMDDDPNTRSYENFLPPTYDVEANQSRLQSLFKKKKDYYRRYRDLSIFCIIGVYALSVIDAYVDAELSSFDISRDLSMKVRPSVINDRSTALRSAGLNGSSYGVRCSLSF